jgi:hypothetical protein
MSSNRTYTQEEIANIFREASKAQEEKNQRSSTGDGLNLSELQLIARESGIAPELIAQAAKNLDSKAIKTPQKRFLGMPISVQKIVDLNGTLSDRDWDKLVIEFRDMFGARGHVTREGSLREWSNGNLHILVEETEDGHRLRMGSLQQTLPGIMFFSSFFIILAVIIAAKFSSNPAGWDIAKLMVTMLFASGGLGFLGGSTVKLLNWSGTREAQFEDIAARALSMTLASAPTESEVEGVRTHVPGEASTEATDEGPRLTLDDEEPEGKSASAGGRTRSRG